MRRRYLQLDVFAERPGAGNPLAVVLDAAGLETADMQALAAWLGLSETVFLLPADPGADYRVRIFTPRSELPFAGHPSVGAAWAVARHRLAQPTRGELIQQCAAGRLPARIAGDGDGDGAAMVAWVRSPRPRRCDLTPAPLPPGLAAVAASPPQLWDNGPRWWLLEAASAGALRALRPDFAALAQWLDASGATGLAVHAAEPKAAHALAVRAFCPGAAVGVPEDPVTGSANAAIAARLHAEGRLPGGRAGYVASQGRELGRDGRVWLQVEDAGDVWIGGAVQAVIAGTLDW
ncbi:PhzF family phenazine biosynthesis protein [Thermomonas flagellata]|uniref:PhzF family phenazine biosynthesis protein n=1 Tax=Thermomonas flagellata TaxID=2888524 RepID=UPI001F048F9F|nr:PhzF family phenazine biosynthesis protein [Thermomonas flagellata]